MQENYQDKSTDKQTLEEKYLLRRSLQKQALEKTCYVCGAGAFGVFFRWLQQMTAFNDQGLVDKSVFNLLVPVMVIGSLLLFSRFIKRFGEDKLYVQKDFCSALFNPGKLFTVLRWTAGGLMCAGALLLVATTELDKNVNFIRVIAVLAFVSGICYPLYLGEANYEDIERVGLLRLYALAPVALYAAWLVLSYKENVYNSVVWDYALEMLTLIVVINAFFRMAGFAFSSVNGRKAMLNCMLGTALCIMSIADSRYIAQQLILLSTAMMLAIDNWVLIINMAKKTPRPRSEEDDGFEKM